VGYFGPKNKHYTAFLGLAADHPSINFYHSFEPRFLEKNSGKHLTVFRDHGKRQFDFNVKGEWTIEDLDNFVQYYRYPMV
jgi:hypothetical protein